MLNYYYDIIKLNYYYDIIKLNYYYDIIKLNYYYDIEPTAEQTNGPRKEQENDHNCNIFSKITRLYSARQVFHLLML